MDTYSEPMSLRTESFLVGLIGDGITSSLTPPMHEAEADAHGVRYLYRPVDLDALNQLRSDPRRRHVLRR